MPTQQTSFTTPQFDYGADLSQIERKRALAQALQAQSLEPVQQQTAGGWVVPTSPLQGFSKIAQALAANKIQGKADTKQKELAAKSQRDYQEMLAKGLQQLQGSPAPEGAAGPGMPADPAAALGTFGSHPMGAQMVTRAMQELQQQKSMRMMKTLMGRGGAAAPQQGGLQQAGGQPAAPGGGANMLAGMPPQVVALMTSGDPELVKLGTTMMEANKGIAQRPGAPVVNPFTGAVIAQPTPTVPQGVGLNVGGPQGPSAYPVPGYSGAMQATNNIPNPSAAPIKVPLSGGQEAQLSQPEYLQYQQTGQLPPRYSQGAPQRAPGAAPAVERLPLAFLGSRSRSLSRSGRPGRRRAERR